MSGDQALNELTTNGAIVTTKYAYSATVATGNVISQSPDGSSPIAKGDKILIVISKGPSTVFVPNVYSLTKDKAAGILENLGFSPTTKIIFSTVKFLLLYWGNLVKFFITSRWPLCGGLKAPANKTFIPFAVTQFEYVYINPVNNSINKRIDIYIKLPGNGISGETIFLLDVNVFNLGCSSNSVSSILELENRFSFHEDRKSKEYQKVLLNNDPRFVPFVIDTIGNIGSKAKLFLLKLGDFH